MPISMIRLLALVKSGTELDNHDNEAYLCSLLGYGGDLVNDRSDSLGVF